MMEKLSAKEYDLNYEYITSKVAAAAEKSGRKYEDIILLAATKTVISAEFLRAVYPNAIGPTAP
jgi:uncharacterized pyridoxal phosphate-containing UPF0001 family protein